MRRSTQNSRHEKRVAKDVIEEAFVIVLYTTLLARADHDSLISARRATADRNRRSVVHAELALKMQGQRACRLRPQREVLVQEDEEMSNNTQTHLFGTAIAYAIS